MTAVAQDPPPSAAPDPGAPPVAVGYASPFPGPRQPAAPWAAVTACAAGLVLLGFALGALATPHVSMLPQGARRAGPMADVVAPLLVVFGIVCSLAGFAFLGVGFRSLVGLSRPAP